MPAIPAGGKLPEAAMEGMEAAQAAINVALSRSIMDMQRSMVAQLVGGGVQSGGQGAGADLVQQVMAAQGIGTKLDIVV